MSDRSTNFWPGEEILVIPLIPLTPPETVLVLGVSAATFGEKPSSSLLPTLHFKAFNWVFLNELTINYLRLWISLSSDSCTRAQAFPPLCGCTKNMQLLSPTSLLLLKKKQFTFLFSEVFLLTGLCPLEG